MIPIQKAAEQILTGKADKFYIFCGAEYGIKIKYLNSIKKQYDGKFQELSSFDYVLNLMKVKRLIPMEPKLYIIRYDDKFLSDLTKAQSETITKLNIIGTVVLVYEDVKAFDKCDKFLPNYTISFDNVASKFIYKYLMSDYPKLGDRLVKFAIANRSDYIGAHILCESMNNSQSRCDKASDVDLSNIFYGHSESVDDHIKIGIASRDFKYMMNVIDTYPGNMDSVLYLFISTLIDLDKIKIKGYSDSPMKRYIGNWSRQDIYNMYQHAFNSLKSIRSGNGDAYQHIIYLVGIMQYKAIPIMDIMEYR